MKFHRLLVWAVITATTLLGCESTQPDDGGVMSEPPVWLDPDESMARRRAGLEDELWRRIDRHLLVVGHQLGDGAGQQFKAYVSSASQSILEEDEGDLESRVEQADANFARLIDAMVSATHEIAGYREDNPGTIGERTLVAALSKLCPLWPFCD